MTALEVLEELLEKLEIIVPEGHEKHSDADGCDTCFVIDQVAEAKLCAEFELDRARLLGEIPAA